MKHLAKILTTLFLMIFMNTFAQIAEFDKMVPLIDREIFFDTPEISGEQLSPDGNWVSFMKEYNGITNIWVKKFDEPFDQARPLTDNERPIGGYFWSDDSLKNAPTRARSQCDKICLTQTPPQYKTVTKQVLITPASSKKVKTPAQYKTIRVRKVIQEESFKTITVPAEYKEVRIERERTKGFAKWMPIICESNMTPSFIKKVQQALKYQGFYHGEVDGIWGQEEKSAVRAYQKANKLTVTKLSIETMKSLGIH